MPTSEQNRHPGSEVFHLLTQLADTVQEYQRNGFDGIFHVGKKPASVEPVVLTLDQLCQDLQGCQRCGLYERRTRVVFGAGDPHAILMLIGEAPGEHEDREGQPFIGAAGEMLTKILRAIRLSRDEVYLTSAVKCRPPENREPSAEELAACEPFLRQQITLIRPKIICTLGQIATHTLLKTTERISEARGKWHEYNGIKVMPTFHPAYLLRNEQGKRPVWEDMQQIQREYEQYAPRPAR